MTRQAVIPCLRYADAPAAIDFLCGGFGFTRHAVYADDQDATLIHHAQLVYGNMMIMLGSARPGPFVELYGWRSIEEAGGITMSICMTVDDPDAHCAQARAAGADIIAGPYDNQGYPGRAYDARDPGGYVWNITSYDPWAAPQGRDRAFRHPEPFDGLRTCLFQGPCLQPAVRVDAWMLKQVQHDDWVLPKRP